MRQSVRNALFPWLGQFEGLWRSDGSIFAWLGLDRLGRPAGPVGSDFPSPGTMAIVKWCYGYAPKVGGVGARADYDKICYEWARVKAMQAYKNAGGASDAFKNSANIYCDMASLFSYLATLVGDQEVTLRHLITGWDTLPGVVQMGRLRTSYAEGASARWPKLDRAIMAGDWATAQKECLPSDLEVQPFEYRRSYRAVQQLYTAAVDWPGEDLPDPLPNGTDTQANV